MKLEDVKEIIDAYFDSVSPAEIIARFELLGYEFEDINENDYPKALEIEEKNALNELHFDSSQLPEYQLNQIYQVEETSFSEIQTESEAIKFEFFLNNYNEESYYNKAA